MKNQSLRLTFQRSDTELFARRNKKKALENDYRKKQSRNILIFLRLGSYKNNTMLASSLLLTSNYMYIYEAHNI